MPPALEANLARKIEKAAVHGSGDMGNATAVHLANAGVPPMMLDVVHGTLLPAEAKRGLSLESRSAASSPTSSYSHSSSPPRGPLALDAHQWQRAGLILVGGPAPTRGELRPLALDAEPDSFDRERPAGRLHLRPPQADS